MIQGQVTGTGVTVPTMDIAIRIAGGRTVRIATARVAAGGETTITDIEVPGITTTGRVRSTGRPGLGWGIVTGTVTGEAVNEGCTPAGFRNSRRLLFGKNA